MPILKLTGCPVPASERNGTIGLDSDRVVSCTFPGGKEVFVFTYPSASYRGTGPSPRQIAARVRGTLVTS